MIKRVILLTALLACAPLARATAFTASGTGGDWNTPATWGLTGTATCGTNIPCISTGDSVTIAAAQVITCTGASEVCSVGPNNAANSSGTNGINDTDTAGTSGLTIGPTAVFVYGGNLTFTGGTFTIQCSGSNCGRLQYDSSYSSGSTTAEYWIWMNNTATPHGSFSMVGTSSAEIIVDGDSNDDTYTCANGSPCRNGSTCAAGACLSGGIQSGTTTARNDQNNGTFKYVTFEHMRGTGSFSSTTVSLYFGVQAHNMDIENCIFKDLLLIQITTGAAGTGVGVATWLYNQVIQSAASGTTFGEFNIQNTNGSANTFTLAHSTFDWWFAPTAMSQKTSTQTWTNIFSYLDQVSETSNPCAKQAGLELFDQIFCYNNQSGSGSPQETLPSRLTNSVYWIEQSLSGGTGSSEMVNSVASQLSTAQTSSFSGNVIGGMSQILTAAQQANSVSLVAAPTAAQHTVNKTNNVTLCGANGVESVAFSRTDATTGSASFPLNINTKNNTFCSLGFTTSDAQVHQMGFTNVTVTAGTFPAVQNNLYFRNDAGAFIGEVCSSTTPASAAGAITTLSNNALFNTGTSSNICTNSTAVPSSGPSNDVIVQSRKPLMIESGRSLPLFDSEYLTPAGLLNTSSYGATAWTTATNYTVGQYVSDSQAGLFGGKTTYWYCLVSHTSSSSNRPVSGFTSPHSGHNAVWEEAWIPWFRGQVLAATVFQDGALTNGLTPVPTTMYAVGLLNTWLRHGFITLEPSMWTGCLNGAECGIQTPINQHLAAVTAMSN